MSLVIWSVIAANLLLIGALFLANHVAFSLDNLDDSSIEEWEAFQASMKGEK